MDDRTKQERRISDLREGATDDIGEVSTYFSEKPAAKPPRGMSQPPPASVRAHTTFEYGEQIGQGGMGIVFRAREQSLKRQVAIKQLSAMLPDKDQFKNAFRAEAVVTGRLAHPNVVPIYGMIDTKQELAIIMKLIGGRTLMELIRPKDDEQARDASTWNLDRKIEILIAVCNAVSFAHSKQIIHRDIKPGNIMVGEFGEILLLDWGLAMSVTQAKEENDLQELRHKSELSGLEGSLYYMPPEMLNAEGEKLGTRTDIYLLGACLYEIISGIPPHAARRKAVFIDKDSEYVPPLPERVDPELKEICRVAMRREVDERYPTARDFQQALLAYLDHGRSRSACRAAEALLRSARKQVNDGLGHDGRSELYDLFAGAVYGFGNALAMYPANEEARQGEREARLEYAKSAAALGDFGLALFQLEEVEGEDAVKLRREIAEKEHASITALRIRVVARRVAFTAALLIAVTAAVVAFVFMGAASAGRKVAESTRIQLEREGRDQLAQLVESAADDIAARKQLIDASLLHFADHLERALMIEAPPAEDFLLSGAMANPKDIPVKTVVLPRYTGIKDGKHIRIPVTFDAFAYTLPEALPDETQRAQIARIETLVSRMQTLYDNSQPYVIRFIVGLDDSRLFAAYPGAGPMPPGYDPTVRQWYRETVLTDELRHILPYLDAGTGRVVSSTAVPLRDPDGQLLGVAAVDSYLSDVLDAMALPESWRHEAQTAVVQIGGEQARDRILVLFAVDEENRNKSGDWTPGTVIPNIHLSDRRLFERMRRDVSAGHAGVAETRLENVPVYIGYAPLPGEDAQVMITVTKGAMTAMSSAIESGIVTHTEQRLWGLAKIVAAVFALMLAIILLAARRVR